MSRIKLLLVLTISIVLVISTGCGEKHPTPLELVTADELTSHAASLEFLKALNESTNAFTIEEIGKSVEGRELVLLHFTNPAASGKLKVLVFAQQHGNEPSGHEALLRVVRDLSTGRLPEIANGLDLYIIPQINPDGGEARQRRNANDTDLNRVHLTLSEPEVLALHQTFREITPEVTLDIHEYGRGGNAWKDLGIIKNFGSQMGAISNPNIPIALRTFCWNRVMPFVESQITQKNIFYERYLVVGDPNARFRYSTCAINDGRNSLGMYNTLSFLIEGMREETAEGNIHERERQQYETIVAFLTFFARNAGEAAKLVSDERAKEESGDLKPDVSLVMDYEKDPARPGVEVKVFNLETETIEDRTFENFYPLVQSDLTVQRPQGYAIPSDRTEIVEILQRHGLTVTQSENRIRASVESYRIRSVAAVEREDKDSFDIEVDVARSVRNIPEGYFIIWTNGARSSHIVSILEPQSQFGIAPLPEFSDLLRVGSNFPVLRIMKILE